MDGRPDLRDKAAFSNLSGVTCGYISRIDFFNSGVDRRAKRLRSPGCQRCRHICACVGIPRACGVCTQGTHTSKGGKFLKKLWCCVGGSITR